MKLAALICDAPHALAETEISMLTHDSRQAASGALFFAIEGTTRDGHDYVAEVVGKGALAVVRKDHPKAREIESASGGRLVWVSDTRLALGKVASRFYGEPSNDLVVCGVTGTNGKTTTTYLMEAVLSVAGLKPAVIGTVENRLGDYRVESSHTTPDALGLQKLLRDFVDRGATAVSMEISSHALDQKRVAGLKIDCAIFTNLTQDHLDYHGTMEEYFLAKTKLFFDYPLKARVIHTDDAYGARLAKLCAERGFEVITTGRQGCTVSYGALGISADGIVGSVAINFRGTKKTIELRSPLLGAFNAQNLAGAIGAGLGLGIDPEAIARALTTARQVPGRMQTVPNTRGCTVVVDYAHTPDALDKALKTLRPLCRGKLVCVFGCGGDRDPLKRPIMGELAARLADEVFVTSDNPRTEDPEKIIDQIMTGMQSSGQVRRTGDRRAAIAQAIGVLRPGDILLIAGKGHEDYQIIGTKKLPFDDREVALENLLNGTA